VREDDNDNDGDAVPRDHRAPVAAITFCNPAFAGSAALDVKQEPAVTKREDASPQRTAGISSLTLSSSSSSSSSLLSDWDDMSMVGKCADDSSAGTNDDHDSENVDKEVANRGRTVGDDRESDIDIDGIISIHDDASVYTDSVSDSVSDNGTGGDSDNDSDEYLDPYEPPRTYPIAIVPRARPAAMAASQGLRQAIADSSHDHPTTSFVLGTPPPRSPPPRSPSPGPGMFRSLTPVEHLGGSVDTDEDITLDDLRSSTPPPTRSSRSFLALCRLSGGPGIPDSPAPPALTDGRNMSLDSGIDNSFSLCAHSFSL